MQVRVPSRAREARAAWAAVGSRLGSRVVACLAAVAVTLSIGCATPGESGSIDVPETPTELSLPSAPRSIADLIASTPEFSTLSAAFEHAGIRGIFDGAGEHTLFAPTNAAFARLPPGVLDSLLLDENRDRLKYLLLSHALGEPLSNAALEADVERGNGHWDLANLRGTTLTVATRGGWIVVGLVGGGQAVVSTADIDVPNGVVHAVESVMVPRY